jgi:hypothetical protein
MTLDIALEALGLLAAALIGMGAAVGLMALLWPNRRTWPREQHHTYFASTRRVPEE